VVLLDRKSCFVNRDSKINSFLYSFEVLQKIAKGLNTTTDYLMNGATDEVANAQLKDKELLNLFKSIEQLSDEDKSMIKLFLDALVTKRKIQSIA